MSWICSHCRHDHHADCKGTVGGDTCACQHQHLMDVSNDRALALKIGKRYYVRHGRLGRVITAWSLAGAQLFLPNTTALDRAYSKLCQSGHAPRVIPIVGYDGENP